jgi:nitroreductase
LSLRIKDWLFGRFSPQKALRDHRLNSPKNFSNPMNTNTTISPDQLRERLEWRYATKQFDPNRKISPEVWAALEDALVLTPSSGGLQPWAFIVITDPGLRSRLMAASFNQPQIAAASHLVVFAAKTDVNEAHVDAHVTRTAEMHGVKPDTLGGLRNMLMGGIVNAQGPAERKAWAGRQTSIALGNLLTSAALLGVDACPMEGFVPAQYDEILGLNQRGLGSISLCALGYRLSTDRYAGAPKVRFPKEQVIYHLGD